MTCPKENGLFILVFILLLPAKNLLYAQPIESNGKPGTDIFNISALTYYQTSNKNEPLTNILGIYKTGEFRLAATNVLNAGIPGQFYWVHFSILNKGNQQGPCIIDIDNSRLNEIELFKQSADSLVSMGKLGDFYRFSQRRILHKNFVYADSLLPHQKNEYFLFVNQVGHTFTLPIKVFNTNQFRSATFRDYLFDGFTYGILLFVAVLSFFFFLNSKHYLYLYYSLYLLTAILWFLAYFGLGYEYIWNNHPSLNTAMAPGMASLNIYLNLQICQVLLKLYRHQPLLNKLANFIKYALLAAGIFPFCINLNMLGYGPNHLYLIIFLFIILIAMLIVSFAVISFSFKGILAARFYLVASLLKAASIINLALLELGITPAIVNMEGLLQIGIFIEITLLTFVLALRYSRFKSKTFVKVIEAHENERALISKEIHDGISGSLTGINYGIKNFTRNINDLSKEKKAQLEKLLDELNKVQLEARSISHNTMPDYITGSAVARIVEQYINEVQDRIKHDAAEEDHLTINFSYNSQLTSFPDVVKLNIFRIIQEILVNILKHSKATSADIVFSFTKKEMFIVAEDNGVGFKHAVNSHNIGMGLKNIRTRVELLEGDFEIKSPAYKTNDALYIERHEFGTMIKIRIPYRNNILRSKPDYDY